VYDGAGHIYGDTALIRLAAADGRLARIVGTPAAGFLDLFSRIAGVLGLTASGIAGLVTKEGFRL
jgi:hypothetical protein